MNPFKARHLSSSPFGLLAMQVRPSGGGTAITESMILSKANCWERHGQLIGFLVYSNDCSVLQHPPSKHEKPQLRSTICIACWLE